MADQPPLKPAEALLAQVVDAAAVMLVFVFCAMTMNAVGRAAFAMMRECRRQFDIMKQAFRLNGLTAEQIADPRQWPDRVEAEGRQYPDYATCVAIGTAGAQREMVMPAVLAMLTPIAASLVLGVAGVMGLLAGVLVAGFGVAIFMANAGGAWDNAKKWIETGEMGARARMLIRPASWAIRSATPSRTLRARP